jgi:putative peptidoglycan lipid II flippase
MSKSLASIGAVSSATVLSRILGLLRDMLTAAVFGASALNSAFVTAFTLPNLFRRLLGEGALTAALIPTLHEELDGGGRAAAFRLLNQVCSWLLLVTAAMAGAAAALFVGLRRYAPLDERWDLALGLAAALFPYLVFICLAAAISAALNLLNRFLAPALTAVWLNLAILGFLGVGGLTLAETPMGRMGWLVAGVLVGGALQLAGPAWTLWGEGWRPKLDFAVSPRLREIALLMGPGIFGTAIFQINVMVSRGLALSLNEAAATLLYLANRLMEVPLGIFTIAISTVTFPALSRLAAKKDFIGMARGYRRGMLLTLAIAIPAAVGLAALREPITRALFERGEFGSADTMAMAPVLAIFAFGLPFYSFVSLAVRAFYSCKDTKTPVRIAALAFVANLALSLVLMFRYGTIGLALAGNLAVVLQAALLHLALRRKVPELGLAGMGVGLLKISLASAVMGAVCLFGWQAIASADLPASRAALLAVAALVPLGGAVYGGLIWLLRLEGREELEGLLVRFGKRFGLAKP